MSVVDCQWVLLNGGMVEQDKKIVSASKRIAAPAASIFELIADPARQPEWDGNDNLAQLRRVNECAPWGGRVRDDAESRPGPGEPRRRVRRGPPDRVAPSEPDSAPPPGHLWRWQLEAADDGTTVVTHTYDWTELNDPPERLPRAQATTADKLRASIDRLAALAEKG